MEKKQYFELLKDPRWQKKRLQIFEMDYFRCRQCESKDDTLNVHHLWYEPGKNPWESPDEALITLCDKCHKEAHSINWERAFLELNMSPQQLLEMALALQFFHKKEHEVVKPVLEKYKIRYHPIAVSIEVEMSESSDELMRVQDFQRKNRSKYKNG